MTMGRNNMKNEIYEIKTVADFLKKTYSQKKEQFPKFSMRQFAKKMNIPPGRLSEIINGKRNMTLNLANQFAQSFLLTNKEKKYFHQLVINQNKLKTKKVLKRDLIDAKEFPKVNHWHYFALLCLVEICGAFYSEKNYAERLQLPETKIKELLISLEQAGLIFKDEKNYRVTVDSTTTSQDLTSNEILNFHLELLKEVTQRLAVVPVAKRDVEALILPVSEKSLPKAKRQIRSFVNKFQERFNKELKKSSTETIKAYSLCVQLVPLEKLN